MAVVAPNGGGPRLYCDDPNAPAVAPWAERFAIAPMTDDLGARDILLLTDVDDSTFGARLRIGGPLICSATTPVNRAQRVMALSRRRATLCAFCADTRAAIDLDAPRALRDALVDAGWIHGQAADDFETCAQEAISNALIHGNLGLGSALRNTPDAYLKFASLIDDRLGNDMLGLRPVYVRVCAAGDSFILSIGDEGLGIPGGPPKHAIDHVSAGHGRGLALIRALSADLRHREGGRVCSMRFQRAGEDA